MIHYNKYHSIFKISLTNAKERIIHSTVSLILLIRTLFTDLLFSTYELTGDHKFRNIIYTYQLNTNKLNKLRLVLIDKQIISNKLN